MRLKPATIMKYFRYWPPFLACGISVKEFDLDAGFVVSQMKLSPWNSNVFGTMYGGSLFSMCDPFYVFLLAHKLGNDYYIWDLRASIEFIKATKSKVTARFEVSDSQLSQIISEAAGGERVEPKFQVEVVDSSGELIARLEKTLYVKLKPSKQLK